jgi:hypothetical protein
MDMGKLVIWSVLLSPLVALSFMWYRLSSVVMSPTIRIIAWLVTGSYSFLLCGLVCSPILGPWYSIARQLIICANLIGVLISGITVLFRRHPARWSVVLSCGLVALAWFYALAVSEVV